MQLQYRFAPESRCREARERARVFIDDTFRPERFKLSLFWQVSLRFAGRRSLQIGDLVSPRAAIKILPSAKDLRCPRFRLDENISEFVPHRFCCSIISIYSKLLV